MRWSSKTDVRLGFNADKKQQEQQQQQPRQIKKAA